MASNPPKGEQGRPLTGDVMPKIGYADEGNAGKLVPLEWLHPLVEAKVGQMKAEMERDFASKLAQIDNLPTKWQLLGGGASAIVVTLALLFGIAAYFGDRQDNSVERAAVLSTSILEIKESLNDLRKEQQRESAVRPPAKNNDRP